MKSFESRIRIRAKREKIWALLTDASRYPEWNTTVNKVEGSIELGKKVTVHAKISPDRAFPVKVVELVENEKMVWSAGMPLGLFKGARTFTLTEEGEEVEFRMREEFTGLMAGMITKSIPDLQPAFDEFAEALKHTAEAA